MQNSGEILQFNFMRHMRKAALKSKTAALTKVLKYQFLNVPKKENRFYLLKIKLGRTVDIWNKLIDE